MKKIFSHKLLLIIVLTCLVVMFISSIPNKVQLVERDNTKPIQFSVEEMQLEHIIIRVDDLTQAIKDYESMGFTVTYGGVHGGGFSHNALIHFKDGSFLELIAFRKTTLINLMLDVGLLDLFYKDTNQHLKYRFVETVGYPEGFIDSALITNRISQVTQQANQQGLLTTPAMPMTRIKPNGELIVWDIMAPLYEGLPFVRSPYVPAQIIADVQTQHINGVTGLNSIHYGVKNLNQASEKYGQLLGGVTFTHSPDKTSSQFKLGQVAINLVQVNEHSTPVALPKNIRDVPLKISLRSEHSTPQRKLNIKRTHGAYINIVPTKINNR